MRNRTGAYEWADKMINIYKGCYNDCKYCYAKPTAICRRKDKTLENWSTEALNNNYFSGSVPKNKLLMFPSAHDITAGTVDNDILKFWEPNAPAYEERKAALIYAHENGWQTSISCEPRLNIDTMELYNDLINYVTDSFWVGMMNRVWASYFTPEEKAKLNFVKSIQTTEKILELYQQMKNFPKIMWKDSIKKILTKNNISY